MSHSEIGSCHEYLQKFLMGELKNKNAYLAVLYVRKYRSTDLIYQYTKQKILLEESISPLIDSPLDFSKWVYRYYQNLREEAIFPGRYMRFVRGLLNWLRFTRGVYFSCARNWLSRKKRFHFTSISLPFVLFGESWRKLCWKLKTNNIVIIATFWW